MRQRFSWKKSSLFLILGIGIGYFSAIEIQNQEPIPCPNVRVCFSPDGFCEQKIINEILKARSSIKVMSFAFTSKPIANALIQKHEVGISVQIIADKEQFLKSNSTYSSLVDNGIIVETAKNLKGLQHNKVILIDDEIVITGSYNFSYSANKRNAENLLIINNKELVKKYLNYWEKLNG